MTISVSGVVSQIAGLGHAPIGDPGHIRRYAADLRTRAGTIEGVLPLLASSERPVGFLGPAADRHGSRVHSGYKHTGDVSSRLRALADQLDASAAQLQHDQAAWVKGLERRVAGVPHWLVDQALHQLGWKRP